MNHPAVVWKSTRPEEVALYEASRLADREAFDARVKAFKATRAGGSITGISGFDGSWTITGYAIPANTSPLPGWRRDGSSNRAVPAKRTAEGKEIASELDGLRLPGNHYPGMPWNFTSEPDWKDQEYAMWPFVERIGEDFYVSVGRTPRARDMARVDSGLWEPVKLSEYHAAVEANA